MEGRPAPAHPPRDWWWIFDPRLSLRAAAALAAGGAAAAFALFAAWLAGMLFQRHLELQAGAAQETLALQIGDKLDRALHERMRELQFAADLPALRSGREAERRALVDALLDGSHDFAWLGFADAAGKLVACTPGFEEGTAVELRPWFRGAREKPFVGEVHELPELAAVSRPDQAGEGPPRFLDLAVPVRDERGQFGGVIAGHVRWSLAREVLLSVVPETLQREGLSVTLYGGKGEALLETPGPELPEPALPPQQRFHGWTTEHSGAAAYLAGYARSRGYRETRGPGWLVVVRQPLADVLAPVHELRQAIGRGGFFFALVLAAGAWVWAGRFARRLHILGAAARRIREGDILSVLPQPPGEGEMARACRELGGMVEEFRRHPPTEPRDR